MQLTVVSRKKSRTAMVALVEYFSDKGCFHLHAFPILFHIFLACGAQALHLAIWWNLDWRSPLLHHQQLLPSIFSDLVAQVGSNRRMSREELAVSTN